MQKPPALSGFGLTEAGPVINGIIASRLVAPTLSTVMIKLRRLQALS